MTTLLFKAITIPLPEGQWSHNTTTQRHSDTGRIDFGLSGGQFSS